MPTDKQRVSLLLVEDNQLQQRVMRIICEKLGFELHIVSSGEEAIKAVQLCDHYYDAILMDWRMPGMGGMEATAAIRKLEAENGRRTPIIAVTASAMVGDRERCLDAGMDDYLSKPFTPDQLRSILLHWTDQSNVRQKS
jgi:CheY-like chemotaxis protein